MGWRDWLVRWLTTGEWRASSGSAADDPYAVWFTEHDIVRAEYVKPKEGDDE